MRTQFVKALARIGYPSGLAPLIDILTSDKNPENRDSEMRALAAFLLGQIQNQYAVSALLERLDPALEKSALVRARAAEALGKIVSNKLAAAALGKYGVDVITQRLVRLLLDPFAHRIAPPATSPPPEDTKLIASMTLTALLRIKQPSTARGRLFVRSTFTTRTRRRSRPISRRSWKVSAVKTCSP